MTKYLCLRIIWGLTRHLGCIATGLTPNINTSLFS